GQKKMAPTGRVHGRSHQPRSWGGSRRTPSPEDRGRVPQGQGARNRTRFNGTRERVRLISPLHVLGSMSSRPDHEAAELRDTARIEAFSDGVFAIAITLLVLELHVPPRGNLHGSLLGALAGHWPSYVAFLVSFVILGIMWANHHDIFKLIAKTDRTFAMLNLALLLLVVLQPFPTALVAEYLGSPAERSTA